MLRITVVVSLDKDFRQQNNTNDNEMIVIVCPPVNEGFIKSHLLTPKNQERKRWERESGSYIKGTPFGHYVTWSELSARPIVDVVMVINEIRFRPVLHQCLLHLTHIW